MNDLLSQKQSIKRQQAILTQLQATESDQLATARQAARERVLREFESTQNGLASINSSTSTSTISTPTTTIEKGKGIKRKFDLDNDEIVRLTKAAEDEALRKTTLELTESRKAKLPNFWLVSVHSSQLL